jgi:hypothetical protein
MQAARTWSSSGVEEESLAFLIAVKDLVEVTMAEEEPSSQPAVRLVARQALEALEDLGVDALRVPFPCRR